MTDVNKLREYYDSTDMSESIRRAAAEDEVAEEIMVSTSIRLPRSLMNRVRQRAVAAGIPATTLMRQWVLEHLDCDPRAAVISVADLERLIAERAHPVEV